MNLTNVILRQEVQPANSNKVHAETDKITNETEENDNEEDVIVDKWFNDYVMYRVHNSKGQLYQVTANSKYVKVLKRKYSYYNIKKGMILFDCPFYPYSYTTIHKLKIITHNIPRKKLQFVAFIAFLIENK